MSRNATAQEVEAARAFLKFLGKDWTNNALIIAVVSWARVASGRLKGSLGTNPFHLYKKGSQFVPAGYGGTKLASFTSLSASFIAAAKALKYLAKQYPRQPGAFTFNQVILSLKSGDSGEFLNAVALSNWTKTHYGLTIDPATGKVSGRNKLIEVARTYTGVITPEAEAAAAAEKAKQAAEQRAWEAQERARKAALAKYRRRPKQLNPPQPPKDYLDPYSVGRLYRERHEPFELPE